MTNKQNQATAMDVTVHSCFLSINFLYIRSPRTDLKQQSSLERQEQSVMQVEKCFRTGVCQGKLISGLPFEKFPMAWKNYGVL